MSDKIENGSTSVLQIFENLTYNELSQYSIGGAEVGKIAEADYPKIMSAINRAVNEIQKDLSLNQNTVRIRMIEGIVTYPIHSKHSVVSGTETYKFVDDSPYAPFEDDILRIIEVYNKQGKPLPLNNRNKIETIYIPQHNVIQNPFAREGDVLAVMYTRMTRPVIVTTEEEAETAFLPIPDYTLEALYAYVASKMSAGITTNQEIMDSQVWMEAYNTAIAKMKFTPAIPDDIQENVKLEDKGFI